MRQKLEILSLFKLNNLKILMIAFVEVGNVQRFTPAWSHMPHFGNHEGKTETQVYRMFLKLELIKDWFERKRSGLDASKYVFFGDDGHVVEQFGA